MSIRVVMFDFGGVLVRTRDQSPRMAWEEKLGLNPGDLARLVFDNEAAIQSTVGKASEAQVWENVRLALALTPGDLARLRRDFWAGDFYDRELGSFIAALRPRYRTALLSNAWEGARKVFIDQFHLDQIMDEIFVSAELGMAKPNPEIFQAVIQRLDVHPNEIIFIDDFAPNIAGAEALGIQAIQFSSSTEVINRLKERLEL